MRIIELRSENIKRLKAVRIRPDGSVVRVTGKNGSGKTSVLDSIAMCLGGKEQEPPKPVRAGEKKAQVICDLGDLLVRRSWNEKGDSRLEVTTPDGQKYASPQKVLDELVGRLTFDPLAFSRMKPRDQAAVLRDLSGLDLAKFDRLRKGAFDERTEVNRDLKQAEGALASMPAYDGVPDTEVSAAELSAKVRELQAVAQGNQKRRDALAQMYEKLSRMDDAHGMTMRQIESNIEVQEQRIADLEKQLALARTAHKNAIGARDVAERNHAKARAEHEASLQEATKEVEALRDPDTAEIDAQIAAAEDTNRKVRANREREAQKKRVLELTVKSGKLSERIAKIDDEKQAALASAKLPVSGLSFTDDGVTLNDLPFEQASSAEQLRTSVAMGIACNPKIRLMLIRDGSLLDAASMQIVSEMAEKHDMQVWLEVATDGEPVGVVIEDGEASGPEALPLEAETAQA